jgi:hypothetical protein
MERHVRIFLGETDRALASAALSAAEPPPFRADERLRQGERRHLLADAGRTLEPIGVMHAPRLERAHQRLYRGALAANAIEDG